MESSSKDFFGQMNWLFYTLQKSIPFLGTFESPFEIWFSTPDSIYSNYYQCKFIINEKEYKTTEHFFQSKKFESTELEEKIRLASSGEQAKSLGYTKNIPIRKDWEQVKLDLMFQCHLAKFEQNYDLKQQLIQTGKKNIVYYSTADKYWGDNGKGIGQNQLGKIIMKVRSQLQENSL